MGDAEIGGCLPRPPGPAEFEQIRRLAHRSFGLDLKSGKEELVSARLRKLLLKSGARSYSEYCRHVSADRTGEALADMIDALTTNHTAFLREPEHFQYLQESVLPALRPRGRAAVWCAACATGEEAWTLAFLLHGRGLAGDGCVLATDISRRALAFGARGVYPRDRCQSLSPEWRRQYFAPGRGEQAGCLIVRPELRALVEFRRVNLVEPLPWPTRFPVIFCRNVMIYFDKPTQCALVRRLAEHLEPGGHLFVGHAESLTGTHHALEYVRPAVYRKPGAAK